MGLLTVWGLGLRVYGGLRVKFLRIWGLGFRDLGFAVAFYTHCRDSATVGAQHPQPQNPNPAP